MLSVSINVVNLLVVKILISSDAQERLKQYSKTYCLKEKVIGASGRSNLHNHANKGCVEEDESIMLGKHLYTLRGQKQIDRHERYVARNEDRGCAFYSFLIDFAYSNHIKFIAAEEAPNDFAEGITPNEWLQGKGNKSSIGRFVVVLLT